MSIISPPDAALNALRGAEIDDADGGRCADLLLQAQRVRGWIDAVEARLASRQRELHRTADAAPAVDLLVRCGGISAVEARRKERRSEALEHAPSFGAALADGQIGAEHVDALANTTAQLGAEARARLLEYEHELLSMAAAVTPEQFGRHCRDRVRLLERDRGLERNARQRHDTHLTRRLDTATGMVRGQFAFHPELANQIFGAVDCEVAAMIADGERRRDDEFVDRAYNRSRLAAEALGHLVAGGHQQARPLEADITVIVDATTIAGGELQEHSLCETSEGADLPPETIRRLLCNGRVTPLVVDATGVVLTAGRTIRHANRAQRRALRAMHRTCAIEGCDVAFERCEVHHIDPWELGGTTDLDNLVPVCSRHHHTLHNLEWTLHLAPDRTLTVIQRDGTPIARCRPDIADERSRDPIRQQQRSRQRAA